MKLFLDTEFSSLISDDSQLISIGLVSEDGREFYAEVTPENYLGSCSTFVRETVLPILWGNPYELRLDQLSKTFRAWLAQFDFVELVTDAPQWDFRFFRIAINELALGWPSNVATGAVLFVPNETHITSYFQEQGRLQHHALHDARALRSAWDNRSTAAPNSSANSTLN